LVDFVPIEDRHLRWYTCGPTVYDSAHLGHARNYITIDILRSIMDKYFGYKIFYCMNITDIDDKIILKARQNYLFEEYCRKFSELTTDVLVDLEEAWKEYLLDLNKKLNKNKEDEERLRVQEGIDEDTKRKKEAELSASRELLEQKLSSANLSMKKLRESPPGCSATELLNECAFPLSIQLDKKKDICWIVIL
jgi:cysteinyl-tRNA synthetase